MTSNYIFTSPKLTTQFKKIRWMSQGTNLQKKSKELVVNFYKFCLFIAKKEIAYGILTFGIHTRLLSILQTYDFDELTSLNLCFPQKALGLPSCWNCGPRFRKKLENKECQYNYLQVSAGIPLNLVRYRMQPLFLGLCRQSFNSMHHNPSKHSMTKLPNFPSLIM